MEYGYQGYTGLLDHFTANAMFGAGVQGGQQGVQGGQQGVQGQQGCQGPYVNGTQGGWCHCNCKCCPPPCCSSVVVTYSAGNQGVQGCHDPIVMQDGTTYIVKQDGATYIVQEAPGNSLTMIDVTIAPGTTANQGGSGGGGQGNQTVSVQGTPICCIEFLGGSFRAVGNGYVTASFTQPPPTGTCGPLKVQVNGSDPPVHVTDGASITASLVSVGDPTCCPCTKLSSSNPCGLAMRMATLMKNNRVVIDRRHLVQKVAAVRQQKMRSRIRSSPS